MQKQQALIIRADANARIGSGHVMRTLALAQLWIEMGGTAFYVVSHDTSESVLVRLLRENCTVIVSSKFESLSDDARHLASVANGKHATAVVIDGYQCGEEYISAIRSESYTTLALDDDVRLEDFDCDWLLNQNEGATPALYSVTNETPGLLLGPKYALLRNEFTKHEQQPKAITNDCLNILVTMGGADAPNVTGQVLRTLSNLEFAESIATTTVPVVSVGQPNPVADRSDRPRQRSFRVLVGDHNQHQSELAKIAATDKRFELVSNATDMAVHYLWADLAICAGGSSNWEMSYFGLPRILIALADNQVSIAENLHSKKACLYAGRCSSINFDGDEFANAVTSLAHDREYRQQMANRSQSLVDGQGAHRVVSALLSKRANTIS